MVRRVCVLGVFFVLFAALFTQRAAFDSPEQSAFVPRALAEENESRRRDYELIEVLADALDEIDRSYVHEVDRAKLVEAAIHGMMRELDPNSRFITGEEALSPLRRQLQAEYDGVGIDLDSDGGSPRVVSPLVGSPAYQAGIRPGDKITAVGGKSTAGANLRDVVGRIQGVPGEEIEITVFDAATKTSKNVKLTSAPIKLETVFGAARNADDTWNFMYDAERKIGYIRLTTFSRNCVEPLTEAIEQLRASGVRALVFDLRFNEGGYLPETFKVAGLFLPNGTPIVTIQGRSALKGAYHAEQDGPLADLPLAVLVNGRSGSGSEIVASCLQDGRPNTVVVGQRTFGKGTVQSLIQLDEGRSLLKLTTAEFRRPSGKNIHRFENANASDEWGVTPDKGYDVTLDAAETQQLTRHLRHRQAAENRPSAEEKLSADTVSVARQGDETHVVSTAIDNAAPAIEVAKPSDKNASAPPAPFVDRQLEKALEYLREQLDQSP